MWYQDCLADTSTDKFQTCNNNLTTQVDTNSLIHLYRLNKLNFLNDTYNTNVWKLVSEWVFVFQMKTVYSTLSGYDVLKITKYRYVFCF